MDASADTAGNAAPRTAGQPLPARLRAEMEARLGADFTTVRVDPHGPAEDVDAAAYTVGERIVFSPGRYDPASRQGRWLVAHELTHVLQQRANALGPPPPSIVSDPAGADEREADQVADLVLAGAQRPAAMGRAARTGVLQRVRLDMGNGRSVGDSPGPATNTREDVLAVMDRMHVAWLLTNVDYTAEYPAVAAMPPGSVVAASHIPLLRAALGRVATVDSMSDAVAGAILGATLSGGVGPGQRNARADVLAIQHAMHAAWDLHQTPPLAFADAQAEVGTADPVSPAQLVVTKQAIRAVYDRYIRGFPGGGRPQAALPAITPSASLAPPRGTRTGGVKGLSWELTDAPAGATPRDRVGAWLSAYRAVIEAAEVRHGVDRRAIAAAVAWEALENVVGSAPSSLRLWTGPGKVHASEWSGKSAAEEVEAAGYLPSQAKTARETALGDPVTAIDYIATIMQAHAEAADAGGYNLRADTPMLCYLYHAKTPSWSTAHFGPVKRSPATLGYGGSDMAVWIAKPANLAWVTAQVGTPSGALSIRPRGY